MQVRSCSDHGINRILLLDAEVNQYRAWMLAGLLHDGNHAFAFADACRTKAVGVSHLREIRIHQWGRSITLLVEELLPLADHAQVAVVDDGDFYVDLLLHDGGKFAERHLKAAIAYDDPHLGVGTGELGTDGCRKSKAHRAQTAGCNERSRLVVVVILRLPHLVLANVSDDHGTPLGFAP